MSITLKKKQALIKQFRTSDTDTGSSPVQIAILTERILNLTEHFKSNNKDHHSRTGLIMLVNRRKSLLKYLSSTDEPAYKALIAKLGLRK